MQQQRVRCISSVRHAYVTTAQFKCPLMIASFFLVHKRFFTFTWISIGGGRKPAAARKSSPGIKSSFQKHSAIPIQQMAFSYSQHLFLTCSRADLCSVTTESCIPTPQTLLVKSSPLRGCQIWIWMRKYLRGRAVVQWQSTCTACKQPLTPIPDSTK